MATLTVSVPFATPVSVGESATAESPGAVSDLPSCGGAAVVTADALRTALAGNHVDRGWPIEGIVDGPDIVIR